MQLKTILNRVTDYKSFVFGKTSFVEESTTPTVEVEVKSRANGRPICSGCGKVAPGYDTMPECRRFEFIPLWGMMVYFVYRMRRVNCPDCGVKVEQVPWAEGKSPMAVEYRWYLAKWARRMSWKEVAECFRVKWDRVYEAVKYAASVGIGASRPGQRGSDRRGRGAMASWPSVPDGGVPVGRRLQATPMDRP